MTMSAKVIYLALVVIEATAMVLLHVLRWRH